MRLPCSYTCLILSIYVKVPTSLFPADIFGQTRRGMKNMELGVFSISLTVKNLTVSKEFYEKLGFTVFGGDLKMNYLIMKNGNSLIGLFQGMFDKNILTFNPGWDINANTLESFDDVRTIQARLKSQNLELDQEADEQTSGPASITLTDPDGNPILIDQHI